MKTNLMIAVILTAGVAMSQVVIPDGTRIRVRLEQNLSSDSVEAGQVVDFAVTQEVRVGDSVVIASGAPAQGSVISAEAKRRLGRGGKLAFSVERVQMVDGNWLNVRYTPQKAEGKGHVATTSVLTGAIAVAFLPAAPLGLLVKGRDATIIKGRTYEVFSDENTTVAGIAASTPLMARTLPQSAPVMIRQANGAPANNAGLPNGVNTPANPVILSNASVLNTAATQNMTAGNGSTATLTVNSNRPGADIEVDGMFVGNAPTTLELTAGVHKLVVKQGGSVWARQIQITGGTVTINAQLSGAGLQRAALR